MTVRVGKMLRALAALAVLGFTHLAAAQSAVPDQEPMGPGLEGFVYPYPVQYLTLRMDARDVKLATPGAELAGSILQEAIDNGFGAAYWPVIAKIVDK